MKNFFEALKKFISEEFLWLVVALIIGFPLGVFMLWTISATKSRFITTPQEQEYLTELYFICVAVAISGVYLIRFIIATLKTTLLKKEEEGEEKEDSNGKSKS